VADTRLLWVLLCFLTFTTSAWAASGWYLLVPPRSEYDERAEYLSGYQILDSKPLSQWAQQGAYDSASECEAVRNSLVLVEHGVYARSSESYLKAISAGTDPVVLNTHRLFNETHNANVSMLMASRLNSVCRCPSASSGPCRLRARRRRAGLARGQSRTMGPRSLSRYLPTTTTIPYQTGRRK